jgi:hypothetical protein
MINFRFHLVSLIAVFLALGLGVVMGATVIDEAIVDGLNARITRVENEADAQRTKNTELQEEIDRLEAFVGDEFAVNGTLAEVPVAVLAPRGVTGEDARSTVAMLQVAGANAPGVLWLEDKLHLEDAETRQELADILEVSRGGASFLREAAFDRIANRLASGPPDPFTGDPDVLEALADAEFVTFQAVSDPDEEFDLAEFPAAESAPRILVIDQSDAGDEANELVESAVATFVSVGLPQVVGEVYRDDEDGPNRGLRLVMVREDDGLIEIVSTVDNLETTEGKVAATWALANLATNIVGQYGLGDNAGDGALPPKPEQ